MIVKAAGIGWMWLGTQTVCNEQPGYEARCMHEAAC